MTSPAFLVEGFMEQTIVRRLCPGAVVRRIGCNGEAVSMKVLAKFLAPQIKLLKNYHPIIIVFDREKRSESAAELRHQLTLHLRGIFGIEGVIIGVADRCVENWIISDWEGVRSKFPTYVHSPVPDMGKFGKSELKRLLPPNEIYSETILGPKLFFATDPRRIYEVDQSFRALIDVTPPICGWIARLKAQAGPTTSAVTNTQA